MGSSSTPLQLPKIDFTDLDWAKPGTNEWVAVRTQLMEALETYGCFEMVDEKVTPRLREALFDEAAKELFGLPVEVKMQEKSGKPFGGYVGNIPGMDYESMIIDEVTELKGVEKFTSVMWGCQGNPVISEAIVNFSKKVWEVDQIVRRMVFEGFGIEKHIDSHLDSTCYSLRISKYGPHVQTQDSNNISLPAHTDMTMTSVVFQHRVGGLEVQIKDGTWIRVTLSPNSFTFMLGETFWALSNGRLEPPFHRVAMDGSETRYSAIFQAHSKDGYIVKAPEELVDDEHPLRFRPYDNAAYVKFRFTEAGQKAECALKAYCGVQEAVEGDA